MLARRVCGKLEAAYADAREPIGRGHDAVLAVADALIANGSLDAPSIAGLIARPKTVDPPSGTLPSRPQWLIRLRWRNGSGRRTPC